MYELLNQPVAAFPGTFSLSSSQSGGGSSIPIGAASSASSASAALPAASSSAASSGAAFSAASSASSTSGLAATSSSSSSAPPVACSFSIDWGFDSYQAGSSVLSGALTYDPNALYESYLEQYGYALLGVDATLSISNGDATTNELPVYGLSPFIPGQLNDSFYPAPADSYGAYDNVLFSTAYASLSSPEYIDRLGWQLLVAATNSSDAQLLYIYQLVLDDGSQQLHYQLSAGQSDGIHIGDFSLDCSQPTSSRRPLGGASHWAAAPSPLHT